MTAMTELPRRVPVDCPVDVKNVKTLDSPDGYALSATLYFEGKRVAEVWNDGNGGPNTYGAFGYGGPDADRTAYDRNREALKKAHAYADEWDGEEVREHSENLDLLIEALMEDKDLDREGKKFHKKGAAFVVAGFCEPYKFAPDDDETQYGSVIITGAPTLEGALEHAAKGGAVAYRVL